LWEQKARKRKPEELIEKKGEKHRPAKVWYLYAHRLREYIFLVRKQK